MEIRWTSKALSDLARLYEFLQPGSATAAARTVQMLTAAPVTLLRILVSAVAWRRLSRTRCGACS